MLQAEKPFATLGSDGVVYCLDSGGFESYNSVAEGGVRFTQVWMEPADA
jgi:hypothetical protein